MPLWRTGRMTEPEAVTPLGEDGAMDDPVLDIHIREDDPLFGRALGLANEVVAGLVYGAMEASGTATVSLPTSSAAVAAVKRKCSESSFSRDWRSGPPPGGVAGATPGPALACAS